MNFWSKNIPSMRVSWCNIRQDLPEQVHPNNCTESWSDQSGTLEIPLRTTACKNSERLLTAVRPKPEFGIPCFRSYERFRRSDSEKGSIT